MRAVVILFVGAIATACTSTPEATEPTSEPPDGQLQGAGQGPDAAPCDFKVGDACFPDAESACTSAGCDMASCIQRETHPVQVSCP